MINKKDAWNLVPSILFSTAGSMTTAIFICKINHGVMAMYIFLDVDGVLNKRSDWRRPFSLNDECCYWFNALIRELPDVKIVLSSTWRNGIARDGSRAAHIEDLMAKMKDAGIDTIDKTATSPDGFRNKEIDFYLRRHPLDSYIILDDEESIFEGGRNTPNLYITDNTKGFTEADYKRLKKIRKGRTV